MATSVPMPMPSTLYSFYRQLQASRELPPTLHALVLGNAKQYLSSLRSSTHSSPPPSPSLLVLRVFGQTVVSSHANISIDFS